MEASRDELCLKCAWFELQACSRKGGGGIYTLTMHAYLQLSGRVLLAVSLRICVHIHRRARTYTELT